MPQREHPLLTEEKFLVNIKKAKGRIRQKAKEWFIDYEDVKEAESETIANAWQYRHAFDPRKGSFNTWILAICNNACYHLKSQITYKDKEETKHILSQSKLGRGDHARFNNEAYAIGRWDDEEET